MACKASSPDGPGPLAGRALGIGLAALAAVFASSAGLLLRQVESADAWSVLFYRSLSFTLTVLVFIVVLHRRATPARFLETGGAGLFVAGCLGGSFLVFVFALMSTNVATVVAVLGVAPMVAALFGLIALGERPRLSAWLAMLLAFAGVAFIMRDGFARGDVKGLSLAALACLGYAGAIVGLRAGRRCDMAPAVCLSGVIACAVSLVMVESLSIGARDLALSVLLGTVQIGAQYILLTIAARHASAADIALVMILEVILAPLWTWLLAGEAIPAAVIHGGIVIVAALALNALASSAHADAHVQPAAAPSLEKLS